MKNDALTKTVVTDAVKVFVCRKLSKGAKKLTFGYKLGPSTPWLISDEKRDGSYSSHPSEILESDFELIPGWEWILIGQDLTIGLFNTIYNLCEAGARLKDIENELKYNNIKYQKVRC